MTSVQVTNDSLFKKEDGISWKFVENEKKIVILNLKEGNFFSLEDQPGILIWRHIVMESGNLANLRAKMIAQYPNTSQERIEEDINNFVSKLIQNGILFPVTPPI